MKTSKNRTKKQDWQKVDARILGQILAAQNIDFVLPDTTHIAEFFAETLGTIPGVAACRVCLHEVSVQRGEMKVGLCESCEASRKKAGTDKEFFSFELDFKCELVNQPGVEFNAIVSPHHHFGFFIIQVGDLDTYNIYKPFIDNLANYVALSLENRLQGDLLKKAHDELEHKVEERTQELVATNAQLQEEIENKQKTEGALRESEGQIKQLIDSSPVAMVVSSGIEENVEWVNDKFIELFGYTIEDMPSAAHWWPLAYPDEEYRETIKAQWQTGVEQAIKMKGQIQPMEATVRCKDGKYRYVEFRLSSIGSKHLITFVDLTERKQVEDVLAARDMEMRNLADSSPGLMGMFHLRPDGSVCMPYTSPQIQNLFGLRSEDLVDDAAPLLARTHPDDIQRVNESIAESARSMTPWHVEYRILHPTRGELWLEGSTNPKPHPDGGVIWYGFIHDITKRKQAEGALLERERHSQSLLRLSRKLEQSQTYAEVLNAARDEVRNIIGYQNLWAYLFTEDKKYAKALVAGGPMSDEVMSEDGTATLAIQGDRMMEELVETKEIVIVEDARTDERTDKRIVAKMGNRTLVNVPILVFDRHLGSVGMGTFENEGVRVPTATEQEYLIALASHMAAAMDRIHLLNKRRQAEQSLRESEERFRSFVEKANDIVYTISPDGVFTYVSPNWKEILGHEISEVQGKSFEIFVHPDDLAACREILSRTIMSGEKQSGFEYRVKHKNGSWQWHTSNASVIRDRDDRIISFLGIARNITERKHAEDALRRLNRELQAISNCNQTLMRAEDEQTLLNDICHIVCDEAGYRMAWVGYAENDEAKTVRPVAWAGWEDGYLAAANITWAETDHGRGPTGVAIRSGESASIQDFITAPQAVLWRESALQRGYRSSISLPLKDKSASTFGVLNIYSAEPNAFTPDEIRLLEELAGDLAFGIVTLRTRVERDRAEESLRESEHRLAESQRIAHIGYWERDYVAETVVLSEEACQIFGLPLTNRFLKLPEWHVQWTKLIHPEDQPGVAQVLADALRGGSPYNVEYRIIQPGGEIRFVHSEAVVKRDEAGRPRFMLGMMQDITEHKLAGEALRKSEQKFRALSENIPNVVYQCRNDAHYSFLYLNSAVEELTGYPREDFLENGLSFFDLYHPDDLAKIPTPESDLLSIINRKAFHITYRIRHKSGEWRWVDEWGTGVTNVNGEVEYLEGIMIDITERKQHEREHEAIIAVSTALRHVTTRTQILDVILDQSLELFEAEGTMLVLPDLQTGRFVDEMGRGAVGERMVGLNPPPGREICDWVIANKQPYLNNHADTDPLFLRPDLLGDSYCVAAVPLIAQEQVIGVLWIMRRKEILEQDQRLLIAIADIAANAIHRVMLHEQTELQLHHLLAMHQIDLAISTNFDSNLTFKIILKNVKDELEVDAASILLLNPVTHTLDFAAGVGFRSRGIEQSQIKIGDEWAGRAAQEYQTVSCPDLNLARQSFGRSSLLALEAFVAHYATPLIVKGQVKGVLEIFHRKAFEPNPEWIDYFETLAIQTAIAIESASLFENLQRSNTELTLAYDATIEGWSRALDLRDKETEGHTQRVAEMVLSLASKTGMSETAKQDLWRGALLHDIGKMGIPDSILLKIGPLSEDERGIMLQHPSYAYQMLSPISYLKHALDIPYCHHEKWDGSGYPRGLKGEEIPLPARLFAVVDVYDALTSDRPYRKAWPREDAYRYIEEQSGKHFDPQVVKIFLEDKSWWSRDGNKA
ncbi:MAG: PAS domain S-box protein [Chloroflexi bacterium]|nr:PAS domain S-box protein [Chloroflexota bacterium]